MSLKGAFRQDQRGVSDLVGTMLLLSITVVLFSGLSIAVYQELQREEPPKNTEFRVDETSDRTTLVLVWGESLILDDTQLIYELDGVRQSGELTATPLSTHLVHATGGDATSWDLGEPLRLSCPIADTCAYPGQGVTNVTVVQEGSNYVLFSSEPGVLRGAIVEPVADLAVGIDGIRDPNQPGYTSLFNGGTFILTSRISNSGLLSTPAGSNIEVKYYLDGGGTPFYQYTRSTFLAAGAWFTVENPALSLSTGAHTVRVSVAGTPSFLEAGYANNDNTPSLVVVTGIGDPNAAFEDGDDDGLYNPYVASDALLAASAVTDGIHTSAANKGLVIPGSVGAISTGSANIQFVASKRLVIGVDLTTTTNRHIILTAGTEFNTTGSRLLKSDGDLTITGATKVDVTGDSLDASGADDILVTSTAGPILGVGSYFYINGLGSDPDEVTLTASAGLVDLQGAQFKATDNIRITSNGALYVKDANFDSGNDIYFAVTLASNPVYVQGVSIRDDDSGTDCADVNPDAADANIVGTPVLGRVDGFC